MYWTGDLAHRVATLPKRALAVLKSRASMTENPVLVAMEIERLHQGISIKKLNEKAGYNEGQWTWIITGQHKPSFQCVYDYAQALGYRLELKKEDLK